MDIDTTVLTDLEIDVEVLKELEIEIEQIRVFPDFFYEKKVVIICINYLVTKRQK